MLHGAASRSFTTIQSSATTSILRRCRLSSPIVTIDRCLSSSSSSDSDDSRPGPKVAPSSFSNKINPNSRASLYQRWKETPSAKSQKKSNPSIWDESTDLARIFEGNAAFIAEKKASDPDYFQRQAKGQSPEYLLLGCSDSRVGAQELMGLDQGELFIHRNIANVFVSTDMNMLSVIFYAVNVLKVKDIIVLGHYECGGVRAASQNQDLGLIEHWLSSIRDVQRLHQDELSAIEDPEKRHRRLVELNVQEQCFKLYGNSIVQQMQAKTGRPRIHGLVYDIANGKLINLDVNFKDILRKYRDIYAVADFRKYAPLHIDEVLGIADKGKGDETTDRLVVIQTEGDEDDGSSNPRPLQCRGTTTIMDLKTAIAKSTGMDVGRQTLYRGSTALTDDNMTLLEAGVTDICDLDLKEEIVPKAFRR